MQIIGTEYNSQPMSILHGCEFSFVHLFQSKKHFYTCFFRLFCLILRCDIAIVVFTLYERYCDILIKRRYFALFLTIRNLGNFWISSTKTLHELMPRDDYIHTRKCAEGKLCPLGALYGCIIYCHQRGSLDSACSLLKVFLGPRIGTSR